MKRNKSPGANNITVELLKESGESMFEFLTFLFSECLKQGKTPKDWENTVVILLHKKLGWTNLSNYRPISLLDCTYKIFSKIVNNRITRTLDKNQSIEQAGFRRGFSTIDHLQPINQLIEKTRVPETAGGSIHWLQKSFWFYWDWCCYVFTKRIRSRRSLHQDT